MYQIKAASTITGLNTETLRAWERRYAAVIPLRDEKGRRVYTEQDVERLTLLKQATQNGHSIGKISGLKNEQLQNLLSGVTNHADTNNEVLFAQVLEALLEYNLEKCEQLLRRALIAMEPLSYASDLLLPLLHKIGDLWHQGQLSIAQEHMFSNCVKRIALSIIHSSTPFSGYEAKLMFTTLSGEQHEFGVLLACLVASQQHSSCFYMGPNMPVDDILKAQTHLYTDVIVLSLVNNPEQNAALQQLLQLNEEIDGKTRIWVSGAAAQQLNNDGLIPQEIRVLNSLDDFDYRLNLLNREIKNGTLLS